MPEFIIVFTTDHNLTVLTLKTKTGYVIVRNNDIFTMDATSQALPNGKCRCNE